ncbi:MAG TPA: glycosyltransferase family 4 protein [Candidatus Angelobacter sp.]|nr:glycosyltransferase family 4 protein [Candidatus Angelobacter sp.]
MRPLIVDLGREFRGGQNQALLLLQGLRERSHAAELIAVSESRLASRAREIGVPVHTIDSKRRRLAAAQHIRRLVLDRRMDVVHANEPHALTSAWLARAHRAVPMIVSRRVALPLSRGAFSLARYRAAARIAAVSHFVERSILQSGISAERILVIYDGVRIPTEISPTERESARSRIGIPQDALCIGNVAAFVPEKGQVLLLEAFAKLHAQFSEGILLLRGEGPELPKLQTLARELRLADAVKFLPPDTEIETAFAAMDIFAFPSHEEPLGSALLAAMAHGLPVVAIARGGIPEVVEAGRNGLLVDKLDPAAFASVLARLLSQPDEAARLGRAGRETVIARFSASRMVEETLRLYESVVTGD